MAEESAVKVCVRVRPLVEREEIAALEKAEPVQLFWKADKKSIHQIDDGNSSKSFNFDRVFSAEESTNQLYQAIAKPLVVSTVEGYNGTIFAYGQTCSGKTFTMMGSDRSPGVIPLAIEEVFQTIKSFPKKEFLLRVSYMEIYNETVSDLLVDSWKRKPLEVRETMNKNIYVADLTEEMVTSPAQVLAWIRKGEKNRHYGATKMNQRSSRSHTIFRMILESRERSDLASGENADGAIIVSNLNLVDLAGSERASQTGAEGARFKEGCNINRSLFTLAQVIKKVTDENQKGFTNYRDSKLTRILQNSLGGNAKTVIICTITPASLEETLSTLQFASTAKKMKNDPHVTEVSDDGALLKRYRNEITDLKRRLQEVSSVTQTTATEKEVLAQLLQEKDQLQREQEDRIRNLTKLLVTSSNVVPVQKIPKRRVTWGGKMLRLARPSVCGGGSSDLSFAESFSRKRKVNNSSFVELDEDDEYFESHWGIPEEPPDDLETNQSSVTVRSFADSPRDFESPERICELSEKASNLQLQLEMVSQQREEVMTKAETLNSRVEELELQLQVEAQQKQEALEKVQTAEQRVAELEKQLQTQAQENLEAVQCLELRVLDLERQVEEMSHSDAEEKMRKEFAETIQLCETLAAEKDTVITERDYLKEELGMFIEQTENLEKEKAALSQELKERRDLDEFKSLEEGCRKEHEDELHGELSSLKKSIDSYEFQCQELQIKLQTMSEELKKKTEFAEELQNMSGKDLVQEVAKLRRSLDDAEGVSRDTKKEWAFLRSRNIALEEQNITLTDNHKKMEAELSSVHVQLEMERSRNRKMQTDLQKELNIAFEENTKLTTLLDGKVPKNLIDSIELERSVANLNKELTESRESKEALAAQLEELASLQTLPEKVDSLTKQVCDLSEELQVVKSQRDGQLSVQADGEEEAQQLRGSLQTSQEEILKIQADLQASALREGELSQQCTDATQQLDSLRSDLKQACAERSQLMASVDERDMKAAETQAFLQSLQHELQEQKRKNSDLVKSLEQKESELGEQMQRLSQELQCLQNEKEALQVTSVLSSAEEVERLHSAIASLTEERDQLKLDLQENVELMIENQDELRTALEKNRELLRQAKLQETAQTSKLDGPSDISSQLEDLQANIKRLSEELDCVRMERDGLLSEMTVSTQTSKDEMEKLLYRITSLTEQRDQLLETVEGLRLEKKQLREEMEQRMEMLVQTQHGPEKPEMFTSVLKEDDKQTQLYQEIKILTEKFENAQMENDALRLEKEAGQASTEEMEMLLCRVTSLTEERDQLQQILEGLREEKQQLRAELEDRLETMQYEFQQQVAYEPQQPTEEQEAQRLLEIQQLEERLEVANNHVNKLKSDLQLNVEVMIETQEELKESQEKSKVLQEQVTMLRNQAAQLESRHSQGNYSESIIQRLTEELESMRAEKECPLSERTANTESYKEELEKLHYRVMSLSKERDELQEVLYGLRQERQQFRSESEERMESLLDEVSQLTMSLQTVTEQKKQLEDDLQQNMKMVSSTQVLQKTIQEELCEQRTINSNLEKLSQERESSLVEKIRDLENKLESVEALLSENISNHQTRTEEKQQLHCQGTSLIEERQQLQEILEGLRQEKQQLKVEQDDRIRSLQAEIKEMANKLQSDEAKTKSLLSEKDLKGQTYTEEMENLLGQVTSVSEERDQLQQMVEGLRREEQQIRAEFDNGVTSLQKEVSQLTTSLQTVTEQKKQLEDDLQQNMKMVSSTQDLLKTIQEELCEQRTINSNLEKLSQERESSSLEKVKALTERLNLTEAERDRLLSVKEANTHHSLEMDKLLCSVTSLGKEKEELQKMVQALMEEEKQLRAELETKVEMVLSIQEKLSQEEQLNRQQQTEKGEEEAKLKQKMQQLEEQLKLYSEEHSHVKAEAEASQQSLNEANATISALTVQLNTLEQSRKQVKERASSRLQESAGNLQESFGKFQQLIETCSKYKSSPLFNVLNMQLNHSLLTALPKPTLDAYDAMCQLVLQAVQKLMNTEEQLHERAHFYRKMFEELVNKDLSIFEEKRVQDVLQCRVQAPGYSVKEEDFSALWEHRLNELVDKRQIYLQKMGGIYEKLDATLTAFLSEMKTEIIERQKFKQQLRAMIDNQPVNFSGLDEALVQERDRLSALAQNSKISLQGPLQITADENNCFIDELKQLLAQAESQLREVKSKNSTLLQALEGVPLKTELSLLKENQQLTVQLQQAEENIKVLHAETKQLEEARRQANSRVSTHKEATQLLQTELQDSRALVEEKEDTIQALKSKLRESEKKALPVEQETLQDKLFKLEVQLTSVSDEHQQEIQRMNKLLSEKEESLRKLKEALRKSQQEGEGSFLQGEDLHARLTNPRGVMTTSSVLLEKNKLEEEVRQLQLKITQLESLVSSQQAKISKWKNRAIKLKVKNKADLDKPSSPCTPTKRGFLMTSDSTDLLSSPAKFLVSPKKPLASPLKVLDSPWKQLDSPKSSFFDVDGTSERLSRNRPKQFFDNSSLGIPPEVSYAPETAGEEGTTEGTSTKEWWSDSAKEDMCKTQ